MAERAEPAEPETVGVTVSRVTLEQLRSLAARWQTSVESALARLVRDALRRRAAFPPGAPPLPRGSPRTASTPTRTLPGGSCTTSPGSGRRQKSGTGASSGGERGGAVGGAPAR